jgi:hypothetical protein
MRRHATSCCATTDGPHQKPVAVQLGVIVVTVVVTAAAAARRRAEVCAVVVREAARGACDAVTLASL